MPRQRLHKPVLPNKSAPTLVDRSPVLVDEELLERLASSEHNDSERAKAELVALGPAAVPVLLKGLESDRDPVRLGALSLLALLGGPRAAGPVASLLRHSDAAVRAAAARAFARIPTPLAVPALARLLERETDPAVRLAAARSLVRLLRNGHEALPPLLRLITAPDEDPRVRMAALDACTASGGASLRGMLQQILKEPAGPVVRKARRILETPSRPPLNRNSLDKLIAELSSDKLSVWRNAVSRLSRAGGIVLEPLVEAVLATPGDAGLARRAVLVLNTMSGRQLARLGVYFDRVDDPIPLDALVDVAAQTAHRALLARVAALVARLATRPDSPGLDAVRQRAHLALASHGSRLAAADMRHMLEDRHRPVRVPLAEAAALVGARPELPALVRAYRRSRGAPRLALREAVIAVCRRERIRRNDCILTQLEPAERAALIEILGEPRRAHSIHRVRRVTSPILN